MNIAIINWALYVLFFVSTTCLAQVQVSQVKYLSLNHNNTTLTSTPLIEIHVTNQSSSPQELTGILVVVPFENTGIAKLIAYRDNQNESLTNIGEATDFSSHWLPVSLTLPPNQTEIVRIVGEFLPGPSRIVHAVVISVYINDVTEIPLQPDRGARQYLFNHPVANFFLTQEPTITKVEANDETTSMTVTYQFDVTAWGGDIKKPTAESFVVLAGRNKFAPDIRCDQVSVATFPDRNIMDGESATVTVSATLDASQVERKGTYGFAIKQINWENTDGDKVGQHWGLEQTTTSTQVMFDHGTTQLQVVETPVIHYHLYEHITGFKTGGDSDAPFQVVGEGGIIHITPISMFNRMQMGYVAVPKANEALLGFLLAVSTYSVSETTLSPKVEKLINPAISLYEECVLQNIVTDVVAGIEVKKTFDFVIDGMSFHGCMKRIGSKSFLTQIFWGGNSSAEHPGDSVDRADLSPSIPVPDKDVMHPQRYTMSLEAIGKHELFPQIFKFQGMSIPGALKLQGSSDFQNWVNLNFGYSYGDPVDANGVCPVTIDINTMSLGYPLPQNTGFFRLIAD